MESNSEQFRNLSPLQRTIITQAEEKQGTYPEQEFIIRFDDNATDFDIQKYFTENRLHVKAQLMPRMYLVQPLLREAIGTSLLRANASPVVAYAEPDYLPTLDQIPTDPEFKNQWPLRNTGQYDGLPGFDINVLEAWKITKGSPNIITAVIDTGLDSNHVDFQNQTIPGWNFPNNNANTSDTQSHGTRVSSVVAAAENGVGVVGIAPKTKIMPMPFGGASQIIQAIRYAEQNGARVANMSFAFGGHVQSLYDAMAASTIFFSCSAGNVATNNDVALRSPGSYILDNKMSVASVRQNGKMSDFSCFGMKTVPIAAPGEYVLGASPGNKYELSAGTSHSAPQVAGVAALVLSVDSKLKAKDVKKILEDTVTPVTSLQGKITTGGMVNAGKAVALAAANSGVTPLPPPTTSALGTPTNLRITNTSTSSITLAWNAPTDSSGISHYEVFRNGSKIAETSALTFTDTTNLTPNTSYSYAVRSRGTSNPSNSTSGTTQSNATPPPPPPPPSGLAEWSATKAYTGSTRVAFQGNEYIANYYTYGERPGSSTAWKLVGPLK